MSGYMDFGDLGAGWGQQSINTSGLGYDFKSQPYGGAPTASASAGGNSLMDTLMGKKNADGSQTMGMAMPALSLLQGLGSAYLGMKQYGLAKDTLAFNKEQFNKNYNAQSKMTNSRLADRQAARVAANSGAYQSVGAYMKEYGI